MSHPKPFHRNVRGFIDRTNSGYSQWAYVVDRAYPTSPALGGFFHIEFPSDWQDSEKYDFDWNAIKAQPDRSQKLTTTTYKECQTKQGWQRQANHKRRRTFNAGFHWICGARWRMTNLNEVARAMSRQA